MEFTLPEAPLPEEAPKATWPLRLTGLGLVLFAAAMLAALSTYNAGEMGWAALNPHNATEASRVPCTNALGTLGLYLAGMLFRLLGAGAFYAMALLILPALTLLFRPEKKMLAQSLGALAMLICACSALSVQPWLLQRWAAVRYIPDVGGMLGHLDGSMLLAPLLGGQFALVLLIAGHAVALIYFARMGFIEFCTAVGQDFRHLAAEYKQRAAARRERRAAEHEAWLQKQKELQAQREAEQAQQRALAEQQAAQRTAQLAADSAAAERLRQQAAPQEETPAADAHGAALPPRRTGIFARLRRTETAAAPQRPTPAQPEEQEDYEAPIPFEQQMEQARLRDSARVQMQQPPSARRPRNTSALDSRRRENLLDMNKQVDEKLALSNAPGQETPLRAFARVPREDTQLPFTRTAQQPAPAPAPRPARPLPQPRVNTPAPKQASLGLDTRRQSDDYPLPPYDMLKYEPVSEAMSEATKREMEEMQQMLIDTLATFGIEVTGGDITRGPSITRYEFYPPRGLRVKRIADLSKELMLATSAKAINILAPIPGKNTVGIELENATKAPVYLRELLQSANFADKKLRIPVALGKDVYGNAVIGDLAAMPHTLVAGTTGSGKSVCINSMILSMLYKFRPDELKLILVDPKVVEMQPYRKLPHLACPVVTVPARVIGALRWAVNEMEHRYQLFSKCGVRNFEDFNARDPQNDPDPLGYDPAEDRDNPNFNPEGIARELEAQAEEEIMLGEEEEDEAAEDSRIPEKLPYIVIIIDELADLMLTVKEDMEAYIARLTQKARAAGIHLVAATQTPRAQVVTGTIKANIPSRIAFKVASPLDSRVILDTNGAENLLGKGDSLFLPPGGITKMVRIQGAFVSDAEIAQIVAFCASHAKQNFERAMEAEMETQENGGSAGDNGGRIGHKGMSTEEDELYTRCVELVVTQRKASTSMLQRAFSIGYGRAAKIMDAMEKNGVIAPAGGNTARPREVLID